MTKMTDSLQKHVKVLASCLFLCYICKADKKHVCGFCGTVPGQQFARSSGKCQKQAEEPELPYATEQAKNQMEVNNMSVISMKQFLEAGVHFGHQTRRWNPKMAPYI